MNFVQTVKEIRSRLNMKPAAMLLRKYLMKKIVCMVKKIKPQQLPSEDVCIQEFLDMIAPSII